MSIFSIRIVQEFTWAVQDKTQDKTQDKIRQPTQTVDVAVRVEDHSLPTCRVVNVCCMDKVKRSNSM